jgi:GDP-L-fucose synthase
MKIYVAGHRGLVGQAIVREIEKTSLHEWFGATRSELDLSDKDQIRQYLADVKPDAMIIAAAKVGGIGANDLYPVDFLAENLLIELNLMSIAHEFDIKKLLFLGSSCIYPKHSEQPIKESALLTGALEPTNEAYAIAKIAGIKLLQSYRRQFGRHWISAMPTNLYGPGDNFDLETSHVLPAMIAKFHNAKICGQSEVVLWGTGSAYREFLHVDDLANACLLLLDKYDSDIAINVGTGKDLRIIELAEMIREIVGFEGVVIWDSAKPDGTPRKLLDIELIKSLGWRPSIDLIDGITSVYQSYLNDENIRIY